MAKEIPDAKETFKRLKRGHIKASAKLQDNSNFNALKLNKDQKSIYDRIIKVFTRNLDPKTGKILKSKVLTLDAPPGTGKSFLITTLVHNINFTHKVIVYRRDLASTFTSNKVKGETTFRFLNGIYKFMGSNWKIIFKECNNLFGDESTLEKTLLKVYKNIMEMQIGADVLILDEYTVASPWLLLCLVHAGRRLRTHIVFTGDGDQLNAINRSQYHRQTNRSLAAAISDECYFLEQQMRITDPGFNKILGDLKAKFNTTMETDLSFDIVYFLYTHLKPKFLTDDMEAMFLSGMNVNLKKRQNKIIEYWEGKMDLTIHYEAFKFVKSEYKLIDFKGEHRKFSTKLPLVLHKIYLYGSNKFVQLQSIHSSYLVVSYCNNEPNEPFRINRVDIEECALNTELVEWLKCQCLEAGCTSVMSYPIRLPLSTYHSIQGATITEMKIVLDLDDVNANAVYVGLSRFCSPDQLVGIRSSLFFSLIYTELRNDDYFYSINSIQDGVLLPDTPISDIHLCHEVHEFVTNKETNCKILKSAFCRDQTDSPTTEVIQISQFLTTHDFLLERTYDDNEILEHFAEFTRVPDEEMDSDEDLLNKRIIMT